MPVIDRASADDPALAAVVGEANFVYLSGGRPDYLHRTLDGSLVWQAILSVLERGGLLAGCSAGAMIQGEKFFGFPGWRTGFALLPGATIIPHFDEIPQSMLRPMRLIAGKDLTILGIEGNTALVQTAEATRSWAAAGSRCGTGPARPATRPVRCRHGWMACSDLPLPVAPADADGVI